MHARTEQLLSIRDGEPVDAQIVQHIEQCPACSAQLRGLSQMRDWLRALPQMQANEDAWEQIRLQLSRPAEGRGWRRKAGFGLVVAVVAVVAAIGMREERSGLRVADSDVAGTDAHSVSLDDLVAQSQQLESLLRTLPQRPQVERVSTAATVDTIERRIQWLDAQLSYAPEDSLDDAQARQLWRERVELMDSLVKVRYAEAGHLSF